MSPTPPTTTPDILVVDDTPDNIRFLATMLKAHGYNVRPAINGNIALRAAHTAIPDLILLDINMPGMDGYSVCQALKTDPETKEVPVIFLSALNDPTDKVKAFEAGGADYISKPFYIDEILVRIRHQLALRDLQLRLEERNTELKQTITQLQHTQAQLVQSEKMLALNQLVAGIAHEINNPISFIYGNLGYANNYIHELLQNWGRVSVLLTVKLDNF
jgi:PleD family two-component response regulator